MEENYFLRRANSASRSGLQSRTAMTQSISNVNFDAQRQSYEGGLGKQSRRKLNRCKRCVVKIYLSSLQQIVRSLSSSKFSKCFFALSLICLRNSTSSSMLSICMMTLQMTARAYLPISSSLFYTMVLSACFTSIPSYCARAIYAKLPSFGRPTSRDLSKKLGNGSVKSCARCELKAILADSTRKWAISGSSLTSRKKFPRLFSSYLKSHISRPQVRILRKAFSSGYRQNTQ